jgi:ribosomal protein S19E (S16A)
LPSFPRKYRRFYRGPFPHGWFAKAAAISGKAVVVGVIIWGEAYRKNLFGKWIPASNQKCLEFSVSGRQKRRILHQMHKEGLIQLQTQRGRSPEVRIIDWENQVDLPDEETSLYTSDVAHVGK